MDRPSYIVVAYRQALTDNWHYDASICTLPKATISLMIQGWRKSDMHDYYLTYGSYDKYYLDQGMEMYHIWRAEDAEDAIRKAKEMHEGIPGITERNYN